MPTTPNLTESRSPDATSGHLPRRHRQPHPRTSPRRSFGIEVKDQLEESDLLQIAKVEQLASIAAVKCNFRDRNQEKEQQGEDYRAGDSS
jgi:hypothetical protein